MYSCMHVCMYVCVQLLDSQASKADSCWPRLEPGFEDFPRMVRLLGLEDLSGQEPENRRHDGWRSVGTPDLAQSSGKFYYELQLLSQFQNPQVGWASPNFTGAVGSEPSSFAFDGWRMLKWMEGKTFKAGLEHASRACPARGPAFLQ